MSFLERNEVIVSKYNKILIFLFVSLFFVENVTRYKHILFYTMVITALGYLFLDTKNVIQRINKKIFILTVIFSIISYISIIYSIDQSISLKAINNAFLNYGVLSLAVIFPILLYKESKESISKLLIISFCSALVIILLVELIRYYIAYNKGTLPFTTYDFRSVSDALVFYFPLILVLWYVLPKSKIFYFYVLSVIFLFILLGTLSRGAWVAVAISAMIFFLFKRPWKLIAIGLILSIIGVVSLKVNDPLHTEKLFYKLEQTDSSYRYKNGTQGTALELIMMKPLTGYGFGDKVYAKKYNSEVDNHPEWTFRKSIGPHNIWLSIWFSAGILGLLSFCILFISICYCSYKEIKSSQGNKNIYFAGIILFISLLSFYLVRGMFEQVNLKPLGILIGFLIAMMNASLVNNESKYE
ncbi:O-antigen ligase [Providencia alcalifaciens]|nr:O-antigen ligase [Providencia alcalifaciens]